MFIVDTNVISEAMRNQPAPKVLAWLAGQNPSLLFTTAITEAELLHGVASCQTANARTLLREPLAASWLSLWGVCFRSTVLRPPNCQLFSLPAASLAGPSRRTMP